MKNLRVLLLCAVFASPMAMGAQAIPSLDSIKNQEDLDRVVKMLDTQVFDAYNRCDLEKFESFFDKDVEFYHDQGGLTLGSKALTESIKKNICGTTQRALVPGTLEAHFMKGYGAVEMGTHRFVHPWKQDHGVVGEGKFISLWQYKDGAWKITRAISYDHHLAKDAAK